MIKSIVIDNPRSIPGGIKFVVGIASLVLSALSSDPWLFLYGMGVIIFLVTMMYNEAEPPVLLFSAVMAWFFHQGQLINALVKGQDLSSLGYYSATRPTVVWLGLTAILIFYTGIYLVN